MDKAKCVINAYTVGRVIVCSGVRVNDSSLDSLDFYSADKLEVDRKIDSFCEDTSPPHMPGDYHVTSIVPQNNRDVAKEIPLEHNNSHYFKEFLREGF